MKKLKFIFLFFLLFNCTKNKNSYYNDLLEKEFFNIFFNYTKPFITNEDVKKIQLAKDNTKYLSEMLLLIKNRTIPSNYNFGLYNVKYKFDIDFLMQRRNIKLNNKQNIENYIRLCNEFNKQKNYSSVLDLANGKYYYYYNLVTKYVKNFDNYDKELLKQFLINLPDPQLSVLSEYMFLRHYEKQKRMKNDNIYFIFKNINSDNYDELLKKTKLFKMNKERYKIALKNISHYYKIDKYITEL